MLEQQPDSTTVATTKKLLITSEQEQVVSIKHWTPDYFSFRTTRDAGLRFENGQFLMIGVESNGKLIRRAYSVASANWEDELEFFSIKVNEGALTSRLQHIQVGEYLHVGRKPVGTLLLDDLCPGRTLWLLSTGTGLAPFMSLIKDPECYNRFEQVVLVHGVRRVADLAYRELITTQLPKHEFLGEAISKQLLYAPTVTREPFARSGRITELLRTGHLERDLGLPVIDPAHDRLMLCGSTAMLAQLQALLTERGFSASSAIGVPADFVFERAFVAR